MSKNAEGEKEERKKEEEKNQTKYKEVPTYVPTAYRVAKNKRTNLICV